MFAKLFFVRDPQEMVRLVVSNLYPEKYLEEPDEKGNEASNRDRIIKVRIALSHGAVYTLAGLQRLSLSCRNSCTGMISRADSR